MSESDSSEASVTEDGHEEVGRQARPSEQQLRQCRSPGPFGPLGKYWLSPSVDGAAAEEASTVTTAKNNTDIMHIREENKSAQTDFLEDEQVSGLHFHLVSA